MLIANDRCAHIAKVKTLYHEYGKHVWRSRKIAERLEALVAEKMLISEPVVRQSVMVLNRIDMLDRDIHILRTEHYFAADAVIASREYFLQIQKEVLQDMDINPKKYRKRKG